MLDLVGLADLVQGHLRVLVRIQRPLVVLLHRLVERVAGHVGVEPLQLLAELGHVLVGGPLGGGQLVLQLGLLLGLPLLDGFAPVQQRAADHGGDDEEDEHFSHGLQSLPIRSGQTADAGPFLQSFWGGGRL